MEIGYFWIVTIINFCGIGSDVDLPVLGYVLGIVWYMQGAKATPECCLLPHTGLRHNAETKEVGTVYFWLVVYSGTSDKGPSKKGTTSLQRTLLQVPASIHFFTSDNL